MKNIRHNTTPICVVFSFFLIKVNLSLICYELDDEKDIILKVNSSEYNFCSFTSDFKKNYSEMIGLTGLGVENDETRTYQYIFDLGISSVYRIRSMCILEEFNVGGMKETLMRCLCNFDGCNGALNFESFLGKLI